MWSDPDWAVVSVDAEHTGPVTAASPPGTHQNYIENQVRIISEEGGSRSSCEAEAQAQARLPSASMPLFRTTMYTEISTQSCRPFLAVVLMQALCQLHGAQQG